MNMLKRTIDILMAILLLFLMAYQVTGEAAHEFIGVSMFILVIIHQILNLKWYGSLFKGKYNVNRIIITIINLLLLFSFILTATSGMAMSNHAVPFLYNIINVNTARTLHLAFSYWSFILMGMHLGLHISMIAGAIKGNANIKIILTIIFVIISAYGLYIFIKSNIVDYITLKTHFAFLDYDKNKILVIFENAAILIFFASITHYIISIIRALTIQKKLKDEKAIIIHNNKILIYIIFIMAILIIGHMFNVLLNKNGNEVSETLNNIDKSLIDSENIVDMVNNDDKNNMNFNVDDGFVLIPSGKFLMGSPETENWRIDDEVLHEVELSSFYIDPYETMQKDYENIISNNPSEFKGERLPVENITWFDAIKFANEKSKKLGLTPCYEINENEVIWNINSNGYRLPTEAEWEYACRAGTLTPFNLEKSLDANDANFYGHYPYEIEENYFNDTVLEARPGNYRGHSIEVGSFTPNKFGIYDCHGNVNEWCFDFYGAYSINDNVNPTGPVSGTRHVYRGGGWNDFGKNMRSAYRAAADINYKSFNLGVRLVRNAAERENKQIKVLFNNEKMSNNNKVLIAYFSWSGNTRGIANEIHNQTGFDIFEISPKKPYSSNYNTVLMEAQDDQHNQRRPELDKHIDNMGDYDTILLGYPNWWASIPMPIATFLEEYDFSNKTIIPFCSHGGGRFGQSITTISKLTPNSNIGDGLSIHYSGGATLSNDIKEWLNQNNLK